MVELAPFAVIAVACSVAIVSLFACGYLYAQMRMDGKQDVVTPYVPRPAKGVGRVLTIVPATETDTHLPVPFPVYSGMAA